MSRFCFGEWGVFNGEFGLLAKLAMVFGLGKTNFLTTYWGAFFSCLILNLWMAMPFMITMIDGALQSVDRSLYESAKLDGAGFFRTHLAITWPSVWPIIAPSVAMTTFVQFKQFDIVYLLTLQPGGKYRSWSSDRHHSGLYDRLHQQQLRPLFGGLDHHLPHHRHSFRPAQPSDFQGGGLMKKYHSPPPAHRLDSAGLAQYFLPLVSAF
jgi:hypothetical protein